jgi:hypothetical protein
MMLRLQLQLIVAVVALSFSALALAEQFLVEAELWIDGVQRGAPTLIVEADQLARVEVDDDQSVWRLEVKVERPGAMDFAPEGALWLQVEIHQDSGDKWEHLANTMLGVPEGETATLSVVDGDAPSTPETANVYLRIKTSRLRQADLQADS